MPNFAPIVVFAFNRLGALRNTIESLKTNAEAIESELFVFVDGPRPIRDGETEKVRAVQEYVKSISGFKSLHYIFSEKNKGLGSSIISGVHKVINEYGKAIVLEDDLTFSANFLSFMNQGLERYEGDDTVFSICGYTNKVKVPEDYLEDAYFCTRSSSWGWATWTNRWNSVDWKLEDWGKYSSMGRKFNQWGGSDCWKMLCDWRKGENQSWAIRFCFNQFLQNKASLFPTVSKVSNNGFDGEGTNCKKWSRFKFVLDESCRKQFNMPTTTKIDKRLYKSAMRYHTISIRLWSRLMYLIYS